VTKITRYQDIPQFTRWGQWEADFSVDRVIVNVDEWVAEQGLQLNPDFQRGHVWTRKQQIAYLEFFLRGGKTARVIYFNKPSWHNRAKTDYDDFVIVDGLQRLTAFRAFVNNEFKVFGSYCREFTDSLRMHQTVKININDLQSKAEVLQWYLEFNTGGTVHTSAEINKVKALLRAELKESA